MSVLDLGQHLALVNAAYTTPTYRDAWERASRLDPTAPPVADVQAVTEWAAGAYRDGWLLACWYRALTKPWATVVGANPTEAFK